MSERASARAALRAARRVLRGRAGLPSRGDLAYGIYMTVMVVIVAVAPVVRAMILALAEGLPTALDPATIAVTGAVISGLLVIAVLAGAQTGPAHAGLPEIDLLHGTSLPRGLLLARPVRRFFIACAAAGLLLAGAIVAAQAVRGDFTPAAPALLLLCGGAGAGLLVAAAMLIGQLGRGPRWLLAGWFGALCVGFGVVQASHQPMPPAAAATILLVLIVAGIAGALIAPLIASRLRRDTLREQSVRLGAVSALALSGDLRMATAKLGAPVRTGRGWRWRMPRRIGAAIIVRDLVGLARTPARSLAALAGAALVGAVLHIGAEPGGALEPGVAALVGAVAVPVAYAAVGPWCRGLRAAAETVGGVALTPLTPAALLLRHLVVPAGLAVLTMGGSAGLPGIAVAVIAVLLRLAGALKGPLPQALLAPVPTPAGDLSGFNVMLWSLDGVLVAMLVGGVLAAIAAASAIAGLVSAAVVIALLAAWSGFRLRSAEGIR